MVCLITSALISDPQISHSCPQIIGLCTEPVCQVLMVFCCPTEGVLGAGEGAVRLHRRGRRRARFLRRRHHRSVGSHWCVVVEGEAEGEKRVVSCQLHITAVRKHPVMHLLCLHTSTDSLCRCICGTVFVFMNTEKSVTHLISAPHINTSSRRRCPMDWVT